MLLLSNSMFLGFFAGIVMSLSGEYLLQLLLRGTAVILTLYFVLTFYAGGFPELEVFIGDILQVSYEHASFLIGFAGGVISLYMLRKIF